VDVDWSQERICEYRRPKPVVHTVFREPRRVVRCGPFTQQLIALVAEIEGHRHFGVCVRKERVIAGQRPAVLKHWHTDFGSNRKQGQRSEVRNYLFVSCEPGTMFLNEGPVEEIPGSDRPPDCFQIKPWTLICYNATELHCSVAASVTGAIRYFFRATVDVGI